MKKLQLLAPLSLSIMLTLGVSSTANASAKLVIDDDTYINFGAAFRATFTATEDAAPSGDDYKTDFAIQNQRLYVSGQLMSDIKFTLNVGDMWGEFGVLDGIVKYEPSAEFNVWIGRMLTPANRLEMNGPYYGLNWNQFTTPLYPSDWSTDHDVAGSLGRDEGVTVWGTLDKFQYAIGVFDGYNGASNEKDSLLYSGRLAYNFLNMEGNPAYYTASTYYGKAEDVFTVGLSFQHQAEAFGPVGSSEDFTGFTVDLLSETVMDSGGVITFEGEYKTLDCDCTGGDFTLFDGDSYFGTAAYMLPEKVGMGFVQPYIRYTSNEPSEGEKSDLAEYGVNYIIDGYNLKINANITKGDANASGYAGSDTTTFLLGLQFQI